MNIWLIIEPYVLIISLFGFVALLAWWVGLMMTRNTGSRLRDRLKGNVEKKPEPMGRKKIGSIFQSVGEVAASPLMPKTREEQYEMKRRLARAGVYATGALSPARYPGPEGNPFSRRSGRGILAGRGD